MLSSLAGLSGLQTLYLNNNHHWAEGAGMLSRLAVLSGLQTLNLHYNDLGAEGAGMLSSLAGLSGLQTLNLRDNGLRVKDKTGIRDMLSSLAELSVLIQS